MARGEALSEAEAAAAVGFAVVGRSVVGSAGGVLVAVERVKVWLEA